MLLKRKNQSGIMLMEIILASFILAIFLAGIAILMKRQENILKNKATAAYINTLLEATNEYVLDNYDVVSLDVVLNGFATIDHTTDLVDNGYLQESLQIDKSPYRQDAIISVITDGRSLHGFVLLPPVESMSTADNVRISSFIPGGNGGVYFTSTAPANPCGGVDCIQGILGLWSKGTSEFNTAFTGSTPTGNQTAVVGYTKLEIGGGAYLARRKGWNNLGANTTNTDLNITNNTAGNPNGDIKVFFNAADTTGDFSDGAHFIHSSVEQLDGTTGNPNGFFDHTLTLTDDHIISGNFDPLEPTLSSEGGLSTGLVINKIGSPLAYPACSKPGIIALNEDNDFMHCIGSVWTGFARGAIIRETVAANIPSSASAIWIIAEDVNNESYQLVLESTTGLAAAGLTLVEILGYIE